MPEASFIQWLLGQTGIAGLAGLSLYMLRQTYLDSIRREREVSEQGRADRATLLQVLTETTRALTGLQSAVENLTNEQQRIRRDAGD